MEARHLVAAGNLLQAHTWKGLLETCGIEVELKGEALIGGIGALPVGLQNVELWVAESQLAMAKAQLEMLNSDRPSWACVRCDEINDASFELCWQCGSEHQAVD